MRAHVNTCSPSRLRTFRMWEKAGTLRYMRKNRCMRLDTQEPSFHKRGTYMPDCLRIAHLDSIGLGLTQGR